MEEIIRKLDQIEDRLLQSFENLQLTFILDVLEDVRELRHLLKLLKPN